MWGGAAAPHAPRGQRVLRASSAEPLSGAGLLSTQAARAAAALELSLSRACFINMALSDKEVKKKKADASWI